MSTTANDGTGSNATMSLCDSYQQVKERIAAAAEKSGRRADEICLVTVTKNASMDQIRELMGLGQVDLGENRVQQLTQRAGQVEEFLQRRMELSAGAQEADPLPEFVRWHMIGSLQRNKVRKAVELSRLIHSVNSLRLAEEIQQVSVKCDKPVEILIEVNVTSENSKQGIAPAAVRHLIDQIDTMVNIKPRGLMCMAPLMEGRPEQERLDGARHCFERCRELFEDIIRAGIGGNRFDILSMGMSADFEPAIEEGANMVRIGRSIVGESTES